MQDLKSSRRCLWRKSCCDVWHRVVLVWADVSGERITSIIRVKRFSELRTTLAVTSNWNRMMEEICSSETSVRTKATRPHIAADGILHTSLLYLRALIFSSSSWKRRREVKWSSSRFNALATDVDLVLPQAGFELSSYGSGSSVLKKD
jgi:hypothetical protein